jgi:hypothetical protein
MLYGERLCTDADLNNREKWLLISEPLIFMGRPSLIKEPGPTPLRPVQVWGKNTGSGLSFYPFVQ